MTRSEPKPKPLHRERGRLRGLGPSLLLACLLGAGAAHAGIPQPGMVLYGKVIRGGELLTDGTLEWTYNPVEGGKPVTVAVSLGSLAAGDGQALSYHALIPLDLQVKGFPPENNKVPLATHPVEVARSATLDGYPLVIGNSVLGSRFTVNPDAHIGMVERVDLLFFSVDDCCLGDADFNSYVNLDDYNAVRTRFGDAVPEVGDADCNGFVNLRDYEAVRTRFGGQCGSAVAAGLAQEADAAPSSLAPRPAAPPAAILRAWAIPERVQAGEPSWVDITLDVRESGAQVAAVFLEFDSSRLRYVDGLVDTELFDDELLTGAPRLVAPGILAFSAAATRAIPRGEHLLAILQFTTLKQGDAAVQFRPTLAGESKVKDTDFQDLPTQTRGTSLLVQPGASSRAPQSEHPQSVPTAPRPPGSP